MDLRLSWRAAFAAAGVLLVLQAAALFAIGQPPWCACGYLKLWEGVVYSAGNSQHLTDWYTISHVVHGLLLYFGSWLFFPRMPVRQRFLLALGVEVGWEILENTPWIIDLYRQQALAQGYVGDSIINSLTDSVAMVGGFVAAWRLPVWAAAALAVGLDATMLWAIRDNLTLNILNFLYPVEYIRRWQSGGY